MVYFYTASDGTLLYMGKDKFENEDLIKYGHPEDMWFHVDNLSSAHVYARLPLRDEGAKLPTLDDLPTQLIEECGQLVKWNSISGKKLPQVKVVMTPWSNLKKTNGMAVGQVSFHNEKLRRVFAVQRQRDIVRRIIKTEQERFPDLAAEREQRDSIDRQRRKSAAIEAKRREKAAKEKARRDAELRSYKTLFDGADDDDVSELDDLDELGEGGSAAAASSSSSSSSLMGKSIARVDDGIDSLLGDGIDDDDDDDDSSFSSSDDDSDNGNGYEDDFM
jgi:coiled-coil domain-containing protein 25